MYRNFSRLAWGNFPLQERNNNAYVSMIQHTVIGLSWRTLLLDNEPCLIPPPTETAIIGQENTYVTTSCDASSLVHRWRIRSAARTTPSVQPSSRYRRRCPYREFFCSFLMPDLVFHGNSVVTVPTAIATSMDVISSFTTSRSVTLLTQTVTSTVIQVATTVLPFVAPPKAKRAVGTPKYLTSKTSHAAHSIASA